MAGHGTSFDLLTEAPLTAAPACCNMDDRTIA